MEEEISLRKFLRACYMVIVYQLIGNTIRKKVKGRRLSRDKCEGMDFDYYIRKFLLYCIE